MPLFISKHFSRTSVEEGSSTVRQHMEKGFCNVQLENLSASIHVTQKERDVWSLCNQSETNEIYSFGGVKVFFHSLTCGTSCPTSAPFMVLFSFTNNSTRENVMNLPYQDFKDQHFPSSEEECERGAGSLSGIVLQWCLCLI